ncbi:MAG TPA: DUF1998 domain-containing protein [Oligoflexus sp.]|uniref:DUF1998 domain-containing protein n=1 Tax=Oligoflexus sp. TaxID=1971216 RepID=UPI002D71C87D|nr:DUF1998 domain-containing protein [Oligoflexus sp.]HYX34364.1 DUF1998 domain-containing protein [Oligoflexus sp.]
MDFFKGSVSAPGCRFRTRDILRRQFHAYLLDCYVASKECLSFPLAKSLEPGELLAQQPFWKGFQNFLKQLDDSLAVQNFIEAIKLGQVDEEVAYDEIEAYLFKAFQPDGLWSEIETILNFQDQYRQRHKRDVTALESSIPSDQGEDSLEVDRQKEMSEQKVQKGSTGEYVLSQLASQGILPNYAFPESGIHFQCDATVTINTRAGDRGSKYRSIKMEITRPSDPGLRELAPGATYYLDSIKAPITRIVKDDLEQSQWIRHSLICESCGHVTEKMITVQSCPVCHSDKAVFKAIITPHEVVSTGEFSQMQIKDSEENRSKALLRIEPFINYQGGERSTHSQRATWVSRETSLSFEFRTQATINLLVRGPRNGREYQYFDLCESCWAVPYRYDEHEGWIFQARDQSNRHFYRCRHFSNPNGTEISMINAALGRQLKSDTIRFSAGAEERVPTLKATLMLSMRLRLGGETQHLGVTISYLNTEANGRQIVATLYDKVPGGTGHLRALMPFNGETMEKATSGHTQLRKTFDETHRYLLACPCLNGCYRCLLSYENQFQHSSISKKMALQWLGDFVTASDWEYDQEGIDAVLATHTVFDSQAEQMFVDGVLCKDSPFLLVRSTQIDLHNPSRTIRLKLLGGKQAMIHHTAHEKQFLTNGLGYTKPDFSIFLESELRAFIYIDGGADHLNPSSERSIFLKQDIHLRLGLLNKYSDKQGGPKVLTFTYDMLVCWQDWLKNRSREDYRSLGHRLYNASNKKIHTLLLFILGKFKPEVTRGGNFAGTIKEWRFDLYAGFISASVQACLGDEAHSFLSKEDWETIKQTLPGVLPDGCTFSGLTFHKDTRGFFFSMHDDQSTRAPDGVLSSDYRDAWALYWILWSIDPELVRSELKAKSNKPVAYNHLSAYERAVVDKLMEAGLEFKIFDPIAAVEESGLGAPFVSNANCVCYIRQNMQIAEDEAEKELGSSYRLLVVDANDSAVQSAKTILARMRT